MNDVGLAKHVCSLIMYLVFELLFISKITYSSHSSTVFSNKYKSKKMLCCNPINCTIYDFDYFLYSIGCPPTNYGPFCNTPCPENCRGPCDLDVGHCTYGCMIGWSGNICNQGIRY